MNPLSILGDSSALQMLPRISDTWRKPRSPYVEPLRLQDPLSIPVSVTIDSFRREPLLTTDPGQSDHYQAESIRPQTEWQLTTQALLSKGHAYGDTTFSGRATGILGNISGNVYVGNTFSFPALPNTYTPRPKQRIERHNRVCTDHTLETVTVYEDGNNATSAGASYKSQLKWQRREDLGEGVFGEVHREECLDNGMVKSRAVKVLRQRQLKRMKVNYKKEIGALLRLSQSQYVHRFVELFSWYQDVSCVYLAMEYIGYGDLTNHIGKELSDEDARQISYQVLDAIRIMHNLDIVHRDIKPGNIFVVQCAPMWWVKIGDFGIAKSTLTQLTALQTVVGTLGYQAPEILGFVEADDTRYDEKCDIWSFGCVLFELCTGSMLFNSPYDLQCCCRVGLSRFLQQGMGHVLTEFLHSIMQCSPVNRPSAEAALELGREWFEVSASIKTISGQEPLQKVEQKHNEASSSLFGLDTSLELIERNTPSAVQTQNTAESPPKTYYDLNRHVGLQIDDIICVIEPCSSAAESAIEATFLAAPQHLLRRDELRQAKLRIRPDFADSLRNIERGIALRMNSTTKIPTQGFKFGKNPKYCDILLTENHFDTVLNDIQFVIFHDKLRRLMIEDWSTSRIWYNGERLQSRNMEGEKSNKPRQELHNGSLISTFARKNDDMSNVKRMIDFYVWIPR